jgi:hypothetical protein
MTPKEDAVTMALQHAVTPADRAAWARLWDAVAGPWDRLADLAEFLGVGRTTVQEWLPEGRNAGSGTWPLLRKALRRTARKHPDAVPELVRLLASELLDVEGRWVPAARPESDLDWSDEADDVDVARGDLTRAMRDAVAGPTLIETLADRLERETHEAAEAARQQAARRRAGVA